LKDAGNVSVLHRIPEEMRLNWLPEKEVPTGKHLNRN